jgi:dolichol-phosphate mannosyltransferase
LKKRRTRAYLQAVSRAAFVLFGLQALAAMVLVARLQRWRHRAPAVALHGEIPSTPTTIVVPTLNEARRLGPLLAALRLQGAPVIEILVVDSHSVDGTRDLVTDAARQDARVRFVTEDPKPPGWIGKAWALECARGVAKGEWLLGLDADTVPRAGLAPAVVSAAERGGYDAVSFSPRFAGQSLMERWIQPSMLVSLVYRFGPGGAGKSDRVLANGQCFLVRREVLARHGGYEAVRGSFSEDVSLVRHLAQRGATVGFLDGSLLYDVRSYESASQMWREWGRSIDLKDAGTAFQQVFDVALLMLVQGAPLPVLAAAAFVTMPAPIVWLNVALVAVRLMIGVAMRRNYAERGLSYWLSPVSDPLAALRVGISSLRRPKEWRGRNY